MCSFLPKCIGKRNWYNSRLCPRRCRTTDFLQARIFRRIKQPYPLNIPFQESYYHSFQNISYVRKKKRLFYFSTLFYDCIQRAVICIFWSNLDTPLAFFAFSLSILVVFINGWTDAPNAIFSLVASKTASLGKSALLSAIFNLLGVLTFSLLGARVTQSVFSLVDFSSKAEGNVICISCFATVIIFGFIAWLFGMPSSESHALISSLLGAGLVFGGWSSALIWQIAKILIYMFISCALSFFLSYLIAKLFSKANLKYKKSLYISCASLSFMHGGQDGQKFIAIMLFLLGISDTSRTKVPLALIFTVSLVMCFSTMLGGKKIINSLSKSVDNLDTSLAFFSDIGSFVTLLICSVLGMPISTGNVKSLSIVGCGRAKRISVNKKMITEILTTSVITFPICFILGFLFCKISSIFFIH
ncbi:MAG: inorganic phosphate transporter [Ruminococcaceae bacterium]|nr:inorganic phosphate transporter [Oscillospiraceae bacterium]